MTSAISLLADHPYPVEAADRGAPTNRSPLPAQVRRHAELALRVASALSTIEDAQYQTAQAGAPRGESLGIRSPGVSDPVGDLAADERRLRLRATAVGAELTLERTAQALERALLALERATTRWSGDLPS